jgi:hypothetical protein
MIKPSWRKWPLIAWLIAIMHTLVVARNGRIWCKNHPEEVVQLVHICLTALEGVILRDRGTHKLTPLTSILLGYLLTGFRDKPWHSVALIIFIIWIDILQYILYFIPSSCCQRNWNLHRYEHRTTLVYLACLAWASSDAFFERLHWRFREFLIDTCTGIQGRSVEYPHEMRWSEWMGP